MNKVLMTLFVLVLVDTAHPAPDFIKEVGLGNIPKSEQVWLKARIEKQAKTFADNQPGSVKLILTTAKKRQSLFGDYGARLGVSPYILAGLMAKECHGKESTGGGPILWTSAGESQGSEDLCLVSTGEYHLRVQSRFPLSRSRLSKKGRRKQVLSACRLQSRLSECVKAS